MANTLSSKKNVRIAERRTAINKNRKSRVRTFLKKVAQAVEAKDEKLAKEEFVQFESEIMKAVSKGTYKKNTASRKLSRLADKIRNLKN